MDGIIEAGDGSGKISVRGGRCRYQALDPIRVDSHGEGERAGGEQVTEQQWTRREALAAAGGLFGFSGLCACDSTTKPSGPVPPTTTGACPPGIPPRSSTSA